MLPLVLWVCATLALLTAGVLHTTRAAAILAHQRVDLVCARAAADAGVAFALLGITGVAVSGPWPQDGRFITLHLGAQTARVAVQDELGLVDVNAAAPETLGRLFRNAGVSAAQSAASVSAIARARAAHRIGELEQLAHVAGVSPPLFAQIRRFLTTRTGTPAVDPVTAPPEVLRSLTDLAGRSVEAVLRARAAAAVSPGTLPLLNDTDQQGVPVRHFALILAEGITADGARFVRETEVELHPDAAHAYQTLSWRQRPL